VFHFLIVAVASVVVTSVADAICKHLTYEAYSLGSALSTCTARVTMHNSPLSFAGKNPRAILWVVCPNSTLVLAEVIPVLAEFNISLYFIPHTKFKLVASACHVLICCFVT